MLKEAAPSAAASIPRASHVFTRCLIVPSMLGSAYRCVVLDRLPHDLDTVKQLST